ncbi:hypothetical protein M434DRAFT_235032 [Hypoxylon sp. CO27-5]|nr:hypothetical protein M434DRAFT_235032 [Hypoxylon sp. CO27-5]
MSSTAKHCAYVGGCRTLGRDCPEPKSVYILPFHPKWPHLYIGNSLSFPLPLLFSFFGGLSVNYCSRVRWNEARSPP